MALELRIGHQNCRIGPKKLRIPHQKLRIRHQKLRLWHRKLSIRRSGQIVVAGVAAHVVAEWAVNLAKRLFK